MSTSQRRGALAALAVAAGVAVVLAGGTVDTRRTPVPAPEPTAIESASRVCPAPLADGTTVTTSVTLASASLPDLPAAGDAAAAEGTAAIGPLGAEDFKPSLTLATLPGAGGFVVTGKDSGPVLAVGSGAYAPGLAADQLTRGSDGPRRGLAVVPCSAPVSGAWFVGGGSVVGRSTTVYLSNVEDQQAIVDVLLFGTGGKLDTTSGRGIVVAPRSRVAVSLSTLAPRQQVVAMHVVAREGRISPAVLDNTVSGRDPQGIEYLPVTEARRRVVIPAVLGGPGARELMLLAPRRDTQVRVSMLTADGAITPVGLETVPLEAGKVRRIDITQVTAAQPVGFVLRADTRILASVHQVFSAQLADTADVAGTPALDAPAVLTGLLPAQGNVVVLAAAGAAGSATLTTYAVPTTGAGPPPTSTRVEVAAGETLTVGVPVPATARFAWAVLTPDPSGGTLHAVRRSSENGVRGPLVTTAPVIPLTPVVDIPAALFGVGTG